MEQKYIEGIVVTLIYIGVMIWAVRTIVSATQKVADHVDELDDRVGKLEGWKKDGEEV